MTNDLMRDVIEGRIPVARRTLAEADLRPFFDAMTAAVTPIIEAHNQFAAAVSAFAQAMQRAGVIATPPPADPRERALRAKQRRGNGPDVGALKERGRVTKYQTKG